MPIELAPYITVANYNHIMGQAGIAAAFIVLIVWSRGL